MSRYMHPVFIAGMPRAGTTLLHSVLCKAGLFPPMPETHFFSRVARGLPASGFTEAQYAQIVRKLRDIEGMDGDPDTIRKLPTKKEIFEHVVGSFEDEPRGTFLEKTSAHIFFYREILQYYPDARFVFLVREPKNVISSLMELGTLKRKTVIHLAVRYNRIAVQVIRLRDEPNATVLRYEDLANEPATAVAQVCRFLGIHFNPEVLNDVRAPGIMVRREEWWKERNLQQKSVVPDDPERWRRTLSPGQGTVTELLTKKYACRLGYSPGANFVQLARAVPAGLHDLVTLLTSRRVLWFFSRPYD